MARRKKFTQADVMELAYDGSEARIYTGKEPLIRNMDTTHDNSARRSGSSIIGQFSMHRNPKTGQTVYVGENGQYVRFA